MTKKLNEKLNGYYTRKLRRSIAKAEGTPFEPVYNDKEPITKAEYDANYGVPATPKVKTRKYGEIKAVLPKKTKVVSE